MPIICHVESHGFWSPVNVASSEVRGFLHWIFRVVICPSVDVKPIALMDTALASNMGTHVILPGVNAIDVKTKVKYLMECEKYRDDLFIVNQI